jgi:hypothetical protein
MQKITQRALTLAVGSILAAGLAQSATYSYTTWNSDTPSIGSTPGSASGSLVIGASTITVSYSGDVNGATQVGAGGTNFYSPASIYSGGVVGNGPTNNSMIALGQQGTFTNTITFSSAVVNPILDIVSLGSSGAPVSYVFSSGSPVIVNQGVGYWGGTATSLSVSGNTLTGAEGSGVIEFVGTFTSLSFTVTGGEVWNGITVGSQVPASPVPEPSSLLMGLGALAVAVPFIRRRKA